MMYVFPIPTAASMTPSKTPLEPDASCFADPKRYRFDCPLVGDTEVQAGGDHVERHLVNEATRPAGHADTSSGSSDRASSRRRRSR